MDLDTQNFLTPQKTPIKSEQNVVCLGKMSTGSNGEYQTNIVDTPPSSPLEIFPPGPSKVDIKVFLSTKMSF